MHYSCKWQCCVLWQFRKLNSLAGPAPIQPQGTCSVPSAAYVRSSYQSLSASHKKRLCGLLGLVRSDSARGIVSVSMRFFDEAFHQHDTAWIESFAGQREKQVWLSHSFECNFWIKGQASDLSQAKGGRGEFDALSRANFCTTVI